MKKEFFLKDINLNAITEARTEFVRTVDVSFETKSGRLVGATLSVVVNVIGLDWTSPNLHKRASHHSIRFSPFNDGILSLNIGERVFPLRGKSKKEFDALEQYCTHLREVMGLDKDHIYEKDQLPPTEADELRAKLKQAEDEKWKFQQEARHATEQLNKLRESIGNLK